MAAPTLRLTFKDMQVRVAEYLGIEYLGAAGDQAAQVPTDVHDLDVVKRYINDGYSRFVTDNEHGWQFLQPLFTLTLSASYTGTVTTAGDATYFTDVNQTAANSFYNGYTMEVTSGTNVSTALVAAWNSGAKTFTFSAPLGFTPAAGATYRLAPAQCVAGDNSRYYLPKGFFGTLLTPLTYGASGPRCRIDAVNEETIRTLMQGITLSGDPTLVALRPLAPASIDANSTRWEAVFYPPPGTAYLVTGKCAIFPDQLAADTDITVCGYEHDRTVLAAAMAEAERGRRTVGAMESAYQRQLIQSKLINQRTAPRTLGQMTDPSDSGPSGRFRPYTGVDTYNNIPV